MELLVQRATDEEVVERIAANAERLATRGNKWGILTGGFISSFRKDSLDKLSSDIVQGVSGKIEKAKSCAQFVSLVLLISTIDEELYEWVESGLEGEQDVEDLKAFVREELETNASNLRAINKTNVSSSELTQRLYETSDHWETVG
ncbi:MAG: hypothetical protein AAGE99_03150 [Chlamydiota bacterium]